MTSNDKVPYALASAPRAHAKGRRERMEDFNSETDSDYTSYWRDWVSLKLSSVSVRLAALPFEEVAIHTRKHGRSGGGHVLVDETFAGAQSDVAQTPLDNDPDGDSQPS